jgi:hypothetical protein
VSSTDSKPLHLTNAHLYGDRVSVAANFSLLEEAGTVGAYADSQFGNAWSWTPASGAAVYGQTATVPRGPLDVGKAVLRAPFRRIPIVDLHSVSEVIAFGEGNASNDPNVRGMWRGQSRHWSLQRGALDKMRLYGDPAADEPSLLPSAARQGVYFPDFFEAWSGILDFFIPKRLERHAAIDESQSDRIRREAASFRSTYAYRAWGLATAQHYGLPSVGLDLTSDIRVALYFALHRFKTDASTGAMSVTRATEEDDPVIYGLGVFDHDLLEDAKLAPAWLQCARPHAQKAFFFGTAWGESINRAADRVYIAARLRGHTKWASPLSTAEVFPSASNDDFLAFLIEEKERFKTPETVDLLKRIYFAVA